MVDGNEPLSEREIEILRLVATGAANKEIALRLAISPNTVKVHLRNIFTKIGVVSRTEATLYALQNGIVVHPKQVLSTGVTLDAFTAPGATSPLALAPDIPAFAPTRPANARSPLLWFLLTAVVLLVGALIASPFLVPRVQPTSIPNQQIIIPPRWQNSTALPEPRAGMGAVTYAGNLYLIGGETGTGISNDVLVYNPTQKSWSELAGKPTPVKDVQAVLLGERIYVPGGKQDQNQVSAVLEVYNPRQNEWEKRAALPEAVSAYALTAYEGKLYLFGGWNGQHYSKSVFRYDPELDRWEKQTDLPEVRGFAAAVSQEGNIMIIGGRNEATGLTSVIAYYPNRDVEGDNPWEPGLDLPVARFGLSAVSLANSIYIIGGSATELAAATDLSALALSPGAAAWQPIDAPASTNTSQGVVVPEGNFLHVLGGANSAGLSARHLVYQALYTVAIPLLSNETDATPTPP